MLTVFKVVRRHEKELFSAGVGPGWVGISTLYSVNHVTKPPITGSFLFAFRDHESANFWAFGYPMLNLEVWRAETDTIHEAERMANSFADISYYWELYRAGEPIQGEIYTYENIPGTIWVPWLRLLERI